jgi:Peptidase family M28
MVWESGIRASFAPNTRLPAGAYYSPAMQGARLRDLPRRPRRGTVESPIDTRLVRKASLAVLVAVAILALTTSRGGPIAAPALPSSFDGAAAWSLTSQLARRFPNRTPGSPYDSDAARWVSTTLAQYGLATLDDTWTETVPGLGRVQLHNLAVLVPGAGKGVIAVVAHRDNNGLGAGANDNATGTAALIQLARGYATAGTASARPKPLHTLVFLSTDGGAYGSVGARRFVSTSRYRHDLLAAIVLDGLGGSQPPRLDISGDGGHVPSSALIRTAVARIVEQTGQAPRLPGTLRQLVDLGLPFAYGDQAPFLGHRVSAIRITTADDTGKSDLVDGLDRVAPVRLAKLGAAAQNLLGSLDAGLELAQGSSSKVVVGSRVVRGWALELVLIAALLPFGFGVLDLIARCRRLNIALVPAFRALRRRLGYGIWLGVLLWLGTTLGFLPKGNGRPIPPTGHAAVTWPLAGIGIGAALALVGWFVARRRLAPVRPPTDDEVLAGYAAGLVGLGALATVTAIVHPLALLFVLPSLYAWLWLPTAIRRWLRDCLYGAGFAGAVVLLVSIGARFDLGTRTPLYLVQLVSVGYIPWVTAGLVLAWIAVASQLASVTAARYGPYADGALHPPRGAIRETVRRSVRAAQAKRR